MDETINDFTELCFIRAEDFKQSETVLDCEMVNKRSFDCTINIVFNSLEIM